MRSTPCAYCNRDSTRLCDYALGFKGRWIQEKGPKLFAGIPPKKRRRLVIHEDLRAYTCDMPLCDEHAVKVGVFFDCPEPGANYDDRCQEHQHYGIWEDNRTPVRAAEAKAQRARLHMRVLSRKRVSV